MSISISNLLNNTCTIQQTTRVQDADSGQFVDTWANYATNVKCRLNRPSGGEVRGSEDVLLKDTRKLFLEYRTDLNWKEYRIVVNSETYNIMDVINAGGENHHTELILELVK